MFFRKRIDLRPSVWYNTRMKKYTYTQNNSGGYFDEVEWSGHDDRGGVDGFNVWVLALTAVEANALAEAYAGVYFDGVQRGLDCNCCGDRWYKQMD